jgi:hypothetical protein
MPQKSLLPTLLLAGTLLLTGTILPCHANTTEPTDAKTSLKNAQERYGKTLNTEQKLATDARRTHQKLLQKIATLSPNEPSRETLVKRAHILDQEIKTRALRLRNLTREAKSLAEELRSELSSIARLENEIRLWRDQAQLHKNRIQELQDPTTPNTPSTPSTPSSPTQKKPSSDNQTRNLKLSQESLAQAQSQLHTLHQTLQEKNKKATHLASKLQETLEPTP